MIEVPSPKFDLYEQVVFYWEEKERKVTIVRHWLDLEDEQWWYKVRGSEQLYPEGAFGLLPVENNS